MKAKAMAEEIKNVVETALGVWIRGGRIRIYTVISVKV